MKPNELHGIVLSRMQLEKFVRAQMTRLKKKAGPSADPGEGFHELRLSIKRLRAFCQLVRPLEPELAARMIIELKSIARSVSPIRDRQVIKAWLKAHPPASQGVPTPEGASAKSARDRQRLDAARAEVLSLQKELSTLARSCQKDFSRQLVERNYQRAETAWRLAMKIKKPEELHRARRRLKDLQYQLEILEKSPRLALNRKPKKFRHRLSDVTTALGDAHDAVLVEGHVKDQGLTAAKIARVHAERVKLERSALQVAKKLHLLRDLEAGV